MREPSETANGGTLSENRMELARSDLFNHNKLSLAFPQALNSSPQQCALAVASFSKHLRASCLPRAPSRFDEEKKLIQSVIFWRMRLANIQLSDKNYVRKFFSNYAQTDIQRHDSGSSETRERSGIVISIQRDCFLLQCPWLLVCRGETEIDSTALFACLQLPRAFRRMERKPGGTMLTFAVNVNYIELRWKTNGRSGAPSMQCDCSALSCVPARLASSDSLRFFHSSRSVSLRFQHLLKRNHVFAII